MKLEGKRALIARTLGIGKDRVGFNKERMSEAKEAITKQDIRDLVASGAIFIRETKGRKTIQPNRSRRRQGRVRRPDGDTKRQYIIITRKLRAYVAELKKQEKLSREEVALLRREIRARRFRSKAHLKERLTLLKEQ